jgi:hypothetical protein
MKEARKMLVLSVVTHLSRIAPVEIVATEILIRRKVLPASLASYGKIRPLNKARLRRRKVECSFPAALEEDQEGSCIIG